MKNIYIFRADLYCEACGTRLRESLKTGCPTCDGFHADLPTVDCRAFYPPGAGGEADTPQHCGACGVFLENPLTEDGIAYVRRELADPLAPGSIAEQWAKFYGVTS